MKKHVTDLFIQNNVPFNEMLIQHTVFKIKMDLGKNHSLYNYLPYYWSYCGSYNEVLANSRFNGDDLSMDCCHIDEIIYGIIDDYSSLAEDLYKNYAPFDFMHPFKYDIFNPTQDSIFNLNGDDYIKSFRYCKLQMGSIKEMQDFNLIFIKFTRQIDFINDSNLLSEKWDELQKPIRNLWFTFNQGLRCLNHDEYYDCELDNWISIYKSSVKNLNSQVNSFINMSDDWIDFSQYGGLDDESREFLSPLIKIYLEDD